MSTRNPVRCAQPACINGLPPHGTVKIPLFFPFFFLPFSHFSSSFLLSSSPPNQIVRIQKEHTYIRGTGVYPVHTAHTAHKHHQNVRFLLFYHLFLFLPSPVSPASFLLYLHMLPGSRWHQKREITLNTTSNGSKENRKNFRGPVELNNLSHNLTDNQMRASTHARTHRAHIQCLAKSSCSYWISTNEPFFALR